MYRLSHEGRGDISFIARGTISYFVTSERSERGTKYDIATRATKLILPSHPELCHPVIAPIFNNKGTSM